MDFGDMAKYARQALNGETPHDALAQLYVAVLKGDVTGLTFNANDSYRTPAGQENRRVHHVLCKVKSRSRAGGQRR
jgi:hypothetical protein